MGYRIMHPEKLLSLHRRWRDGQTVTDIARNEGLDRKTIRRYLGEFSRAGLDQIPSGDKRVLETVALLTKVNERRQATSSPFDLYLDEIKARIGDTLEPVKPKTAWEILVRKYGITGSYSAFKRFVIRHQISNRRHDAGIRIETPAGEEVQVDYGQVGRLLGPDGKNHIVYAFVAVLCYSRLMFIQFTFRQNSESFIQSHVSLFSYLDGVPHRTNIDNLKSGVIKADLWDPDINRAYQEMAEHYNTFIDPSRVRSPQDKPKVERQVPVARELFRMLRHVYPDASILQLNAHALSWCHEEHANKKHGTTQVPPRVLFETEKLQLRPLPQEHFVIPLWKEVAVNLDRFFQFEGRYYALPDFLGQRVWVRKSGKMLSISHRGRFVRHYVITGKRWNHLPGDLTPWEEAIHQGQYPGFLLEQSRKFGEDAFRLMEAVLRPSAWTNCRRGRGILDVLDEQGGRSDFIEVLKLALARRIFDPRALKNLFETEALQLKFPMPVSATQAELLRPAAYYWN